MAYGIDGKPDSDTVWACDCIASLSIVADERYGYRPDSKQLAYAIHNRDLEIDRLRGLLATLQADKRRLDTLEERMLTLKCERGAGAMGDVLIGWTASKGFEPTLYDSPREAIDAELP